MVKKISYLLSLLLFTYGFVTSQIISPNGYYVSGNNVYNGTKNQVYFKGVNRPSLEWNSLGQKFVKEDIKSIAGSCANIVRLPLNQDFWLKNTNNYQTTLDTVIKWCLAEKLNVILDLHWSQKNNVNTTAGQQQHADEISLNFWYKVASKYKSNGKLLFELYNEPNSITWDQVINGGINNNGTVDPADDWKMAGYQQLYDTLRAAGAKNLVIVGGNNWTFDLSYYESHPIKGYNIMYATHCYPFSNKLSNNWYKWTGMAKKYPVIATEFGPSANLNTQYVQEVVDTLTKLHGHYTAWAWWAFSNAQNSMWNSFDPTKGLYDSTFYGKWFFRLLKKECPGLITSVNTIEQTNKPQVYPNPVHDYLYINPNKSNWSLFRLDGIVIKSGNESSIDVSFLANGIYILVSDEKRFKIVKY
jgi:endoglucanase